MRCARPSWMARLRPRRKHWHWSINSTLERPLAKNAKGAKNSGFFAPFAFFARSFLYLGYLLGLHALAEQAQGLALDLADALTGQAEALADFLERLGLTAIESKAKPQHGS